MRYSTIWLSVMPRSCAFCVSISIAEASSVIVISSIALYIDSGQIYDHFRAVILRLINYTRMAYICAQTEHKGIKNLPEGRHTNDWMCT